MVEIFVATSDSKIWATERFLMDLCAAMSQQEHIVVDLISEGPDLRSIGLIDLIEDSAERFDYDLSNLVIRCTNLLHSELPIRTVFTVATHFIDNTRQRVQFVNKDITKTFGMFIGRSNLHRLYLSSYLWNNYSNNSVQTFHYDRTVDFHQANVGLSELTNYYGTDALPAVAEFLTHTPMNSVDSVSYPILMDQHCNLVHAYKDFFVEVVCESYFTGRTFFPTEKTWRAIATGTPFIVQGPQHYLQRLQQLGFKTFNEYWPEGYSEDPADYQPKEIAQLIDRVGSMPLNEIQSMYESMRPILEHNAKRLQELTAEDLDHVR